MVEKNSEMVVVRFSKRNWDWFLQPTLFMLENGLLAGLEKP